MAVRPVGAAEYYCTYPPVFLFPGESVDLYVTVDLPAAIGLCYLDNAAKLFWPIGYGDANRGDDVSFELGAGSGCEVQAALRRHDQPQDQKSAKPKVCEDTGADWKCSFLVTVTNTGPGAYSGDIRLPTPSVPNPPTVSPPPWACVPAGPGYTCTYPGAALNPGDSIDMLLTTTVSKADLKAAGKCSVMNDVAISKAPGGSALNSDPADDTASAEALAPGVNCEPLGSARRRSPTCRSRRRQRAASSFRAAGSALHRHPHQRRTRRLLRPAQAPQVDVSRPDRRPLLLATLDLRRRRWRL